MPPPARATERILLFALAFACCLQAETQPSYVTLRRGQRIHVELQGHAGPSVVFESGLGEDVSNWQPVQSAVAKFARTLSYDRAGLGLSAPSNAKRDGITLASELHDVLTAANFPAPYVLVGHSLGGAVIEIFAGRYSHDVAGLVLVDPEDGRIIQQLQARLSKSEWAARANALAKFGPMPPPVQKEYDAAIDTGRQVEALGPLPNVPTVLFTGTAIDPNFPGNPVEQRIKIEMHRQFLLQNPHVQQVLVPESRHYIQQDAPLKVIEAVSRVTKLTQQ